MIHKFKKSLKIPKGASRIRISKKNKQHNGQKKKYKRINNDQQNITHKTKDQAINRTYKNKPFIDKHTTDFFTS